MILEWSRTWGPKQLLHLFLAATSSSRSDDVTLFACLSVCHLIFSAVNFAPLLFAPLHLGTLAQWWWWVVVVVWLWWVVVGGFGWWWVVWWVVEVGGGDGI